jgi:hypothetical protein
MCGDFVIIHNNAYAVDLYVNKLRNIIISSYYGFMYKCNVGIA